jgi:hypothetical protein
VVVTIPADGSYEFLATPEDRTKHTSLWIGQGTKHPAKKLPKLKYFEGMKMMNDMMDMNGDMKEMKGMVMTNQVMDMNMVMYPELGEGKPPVTLTACLNPYTLPYCPQAQLKCSTLS